ncbi:hypothetical protein LINGRAHAP2_LOCUS29630 [Linum grandiflorum]
MDSQKSTSFQAGEVKGQTQEKASSMMDKAGNAAQSVKESAQDVHFIQTFYITCSFFYPHAVLIVILTVSYQECLAGRFPDAD